MREPFLKAPGAVLWLIVALIAAHVARVMAPDPWPEFLLLEFAFVPARDPATMLQQIAPFVTYMALHADWIHLGTNCLMLLAFGPIVAKRMGATGFLALFLVCGVAAAAAQGAVNLGALDAIVGASGGISGIEGAAIRIFYGRLYTGRNALAPLLSVGIIGFTVSDVIANMIVGATWSEVAWVAHIGGYVAGLVAIGWVWRSRRPGEYRDDGVLTCPQ